MSWKHFGGLNPKYSEFKDKHQSITMLGLSWALYWRFALLVIAIEVIVFGLAFIVLASLGVQMHHERGWDRDGRMHSVQQGKLNINVVCEGALAHKTFPDAASADAFVEECKAGEHPEVIQQYKAQMGLGDGATI